LQVYQLFTTDDIDFLAMIPTVIVSLPETKDDEGTCYLQATNTDVFVIVRDNINYWGIKKYIMRIFYVFLIVAIAMLSWYQMGSADRLHHWTDSKGVTHLSKEPPPEDGKLIEIMEYSVRVDKPEKPDQIEARKKPEKQNGNVIVEKIQETEEQLRPKVDLATACYIDAGREDVYVYVIEFANPDSTVESVLYQGTVTKGQKQLVESSRGKIKFSYQLSPDDRTIGDNDADCVNGTVITIP